MAEREADTGARQSGRGGQATLLVLTLLVALAPAAANHDAQPCEPSATPPDAEMGGVYVDVTLTQNLAKSRVWIYEEDNGLPGLQRGDELVRDETCGHGADALVF